MEDLEQRLTKAKLAVRKATEEALKSEDTTKFQFNSDGADPTTQENVDPQLSDKESFALGMTLFGQDVRVVERNIREKLTEIESDLDKISTAAKNQPPQDDNDDMTLEQLEKEAHDLTTRIQFLKACSEARSALEEASVQSSNISEPDFVEAARQVKQATVACDAAHDLVRAEEEHGPSPALTGAYRILDSIRADIRRKRMDLAAKATDILEAAIQLTDESITVRGGGLAYTILQELSQDESALHNTLRAITDKLLEVVLDPILEQHEKKTARMTPWKIVERQESNKALHSTRGPKHIFEWSRDEESDKSVASSEQDSIVAWKETFAFIERLLSFVQKHILLEHDTLCALVGRRLFGKPGTAVHGLDLKALGLESNLLDDSGRLMKPIVELLWDTCLPSFVKSEELYRLQEMANQLKAFVIPFEDQMVMLKLASPGTPLVDFCTNFELKYVEKRRCTILNEARAILLHNDYHNTSQIGEEIVKPPKDDVLGEDDGMAVFKFERQSVSDTASKIMELCRRTMDEAVAPATISLLSPTLYKSAREILDLFRAIIPTTHAGEIASLPRTAAILHNDCVFLAHHCLTLGLEYKDRFPETQDERGQTLRLACMFVDMVPPFRELADKALGNMLDQQKQQIWEIVGSRITLMGQALASNESLAEWTDAEAAMNAGLYHLRHLSQAWRPVLSNEVFRVSVGFLVDTIFSIYLDQIFQAKDISEPACQYVGSLFRTAMQAVLKLMDNDTEGSRLWDRFSAVGRFMDMSLADIHVALGDGVFRSITGPELSRLITATFGDSDKRRSLLKALAPEK